MNQSEKIVERLDIYTIKRWQERQEEQESKKDYNRASSAGWIFDCPRYLCLERICPEKKKPQTKEQIQTFEEGHRQEELMREEMLNAAYELLVCEPETWEEHRLKLELDNILIEKGEKTVLEYKSCSDPVFHQIKNIEDSDGLHKSKMIWIRHYPTQVQLYEAKKEIDSGLLLFKNKDRGAKHGIDINFSQKYVDYVFEGLAEVNRLVALGEAPKAKECDACKRCPYVDFDFPDGLEGKEEIEIYTEPELEMFLEERDETLEPYNRHIKLDKICKRQIKEIPPDRGDVIQIGDFLIKKKTYQTSRVQNLPDDIKEKYTVKLPITKIDIKKIEAEVL